MTHNIPYERHWLLWPTLAGRQAALPTAQSLLPGAPAHELRRLILSDIPAIVRRQTPHCPTGAVQVGFAAPGRTENGRLRVDAQIPLVEILRWLSPYALLAEMNKTAALPIAPFLRSVLQMGEETGFSVGIYGSAAMQMATGLPYWRPGSDVDICVRNVRRDSAGAEALAQRLRVLEAAFSLRADVELDYQGYGVKLAELVSASRSVLGKGLHSVELFKKHDLKTINMKDIPPGTAISVPDCARLQTGPHCKACPVQQQAHIMRCQAEKKHCSGISAKNAAQKIAAAAEKALRFEAAATPKPGLVDAAGNGAHSDMDIDMFYASATALAPYFEEMALCGVHFTGGPEELLDTVRPIGLRAEAAMLAATGGVNTHKGAIFSLGILCVAAGFARGHGLPATAEDLLALCGQIAAKTPLELHTQQQPATHGQQAFAREGLTGARGQAAAAYPDVRLHGYPVLKQRLAVGDSLNDAAVACLLHLIARVDDTNIVQRGGGVAALRGVQRRLRQALPAAETEGTPALLRLAFVLDTAFIRRNLSPGGSADLLALTLMLHFLDDTTPATGQEERM